MEAAKKRPFTEKDLKGCPLVAIKRLIITSRREEVMPSAQYVTLLQLVEEVSARALTTRWIVSLCDTVIDRDPDLTKRMQAGIIVLLANGEKMAFTLRKFRPPTPAALEEPSRRGGKLWDGVSRFAWSAGADMHQNMTRRMAGLMREGDPMLGELFWTVLERMSRSSDTTLSMLERDHARDLWADVLHFKGK